MLLSVFLGALLFRRRVKEKSCSDSPPPTLDGDVWDRLISLISTSPVCFSTVPSNSTVQVKNDLRQPVLLNFGVHSKASKRGGVKGNPLIFENPAPLANR